MDTHPEVTVDSIPRSQFNEITQNFFNTHLSNDEDIKSIRNNILKQEQQKPFVEKFVNYAGYPVWDKAIISIETATDSASKLNYKNGNQKFVFIPLVRYKDSTVHAILKVKINGGDTSFRVMYRWQYNEHGYKQSNKFNDADQNALFFMGFESYIFGHNSFKIKDSLLLKGRASDTIHIKSFNGNPAVDLKTMSYWVTICYYTRYLSNEKTTSTIPVVEVCVTFLTSDGGGDSGNSGSTGTGGGGGTSGGSWNDDPCYSPAEPRVQIPQPCDETDPGWLPVPATSELTSFYKSLSTTEKAFWSNSNNSQFVNEFSELLVAGNFSIDLQSFVRWAIDYLIDHPDVSVSVFNNRFMSESEGSDGDFDEAFWNNPANIFPHQNLPAWSSFIAAFPSHSDPQYYSPTKLYQSIGGDVLTYGLTRGDNSNTCAARPSKALNYSGITIPHIPNVTFLGVDGKYYFLGAKSMNRWMRKTFGCQNPNTSIGEYQNANSIHIDKSQINKNDGNLPDLIKGINGIYSFVSYDSHWATGHADLLNDNATCNGGCYFNGPIQYIDIWKLK